MRPKSREASAMLRWRYGLPVAFAMIMFRFLVGYARAK